MRPTTLATWMTLATLTTGAAHATPRRLTPAERAEITELARRVLAIVRDGVRDPAGVFPTAAELRGVFGLRDTADAGPDGGGMLVQRQLEALSRDARDLRPRLAGGRFVSIGGGGFARDSIDPRRCGRFGVATSQCADGPVVEFTVDGATRRFRIDTLVRIGGRWRVLDLR